MIGRNRSYSRNYRTGKTLNPMAPVVHTLSTDTTDKGHETMNDPINYLWKNKTVTVVRVDTVDSQGRDTLVRGDKGTFWCRGQDLVKAPTTIDLSSPSDLGQVTRVLFALGSNRRLTARPVGNHYTAGPVRRLAFLTGGYCKHDLDAAPIDLSLLLGSDTDNACDVLSAFCASRDTTARPVGTTYLAGPVRRLAFLTGGWDLTRTYQAHVAAFGGF